MTLPASLIIVSRHRPKALLRALTAVGQMDHPAFEVIVVCDPGAADVVRETGLAIKLATYDEANISAARNIGLSLASAPIVAFLDDDAVPEPTWLSRLVAPFKDAQVTAAGGFVLGRSGLAWQWQAAWVLANGQDESFEVTTTSLHHNTPQRAIKTQGTNCAFRRDALLAMGGFDPGFAFYLDEADVNLRLGGVTAVVPDAVVHHGYAASARRRADRVPIDLTQIGASLALFLRRHAGGDRALLRPHIAQQRARVLRHMVSGGLEPRDVSRLMQGLKQGIAVGEGAPLSALTPIQPAKLPLIPLGKTGPRDGIILLGTTQHTDALMTQARMAVAEGKIVTLFLLARGFRPHKHVFEESGYWLQIGGRFGQGFRSESRWKLLDAETRFRFEVARLAAFRPIKGTKAH